MDRWSNKGDRWELLKSLPKRFTCTFFFKLLWQLIIHWLCIRMWCIVHGGWNNGRMEIFSSFWRDFSALFSWTWDGGVLAFQRAALTCSCSFSASVLADFLFLQLEVSTDTSLGVIKLLRGRLFVVVFSSPCRVFAAGQGFVEGSPITTVGWCSSGESVTTLCCGCLLLSLSSWYCAL